MKRSFFVFLFLVMLVFSGCSGDGGFFSSSGSKVPEVDNTGEGLKIDFSIDTQNLNTGKLIYKLKVKNTGIEPITISRENFVIKTKQNFLGKPILTDESINSFYEKILGGSDSITLYQNLEYESSGVLNVEPTFLDSKVNPNIKDFDIMLKVNYNYKTDFYTNLLMTTKYDMFSIKSGSSFQQASPVQVNKVEIIPDSKENLYVLYLTLNDKGQRGDYTTLNDQGILLNGFSADFGSSSLFCEVRQEDLVSQRDSYEFRIKAGKSLVLECPVTISNKDDFTTQLSGSFDFSYDYLREIKITLPQTVRVSN